MLSYPSHNSNSFSLSSQSTVICKSHTKGALPAIWPTSITKISPWITQVSEISVILKALEAPLVSKINCQIIYHFQLFNSCIHSFFHTSENKSSAIYTHTVSCMIFNICIWNTDLIFEIAALENAKVPIVSGFFCEWYVETQPM